jgi:hypothetical protein
MSRIYSKHGEGECIWDFCRKVREEETARNAQTYVIG